MGYAVSIRVCAISRPRAPSGFTRMLSVTTALGHRDRHEPLASGEEVEDSEGGPVEAEQDELGVRHGSPLCWLCGPSRAQRFGRIS